MTADGHPATAPGDDLPEWLAAAQVADEVRELRPDYAALLIVADGLRPGPSDEISEAILAAAERRALSRLAGSSPEDLPQVAQWREASRSFGAKPQRTRPSVGALLRRLTPGLPRIDRIADAYKRGDRPDEQRTVRDSSLSACTQAVLAAEAGHVELAHDYAGEAALMDLRDLKQNTDGTPR